MPETTDRDRDPREELREARRVLNAMSRACRQAATFLTGVSCLDERKVRNVLKRAIQENDKFFKKNA